MPRNSSGNYALPAGNPVAPNTLIETVWANPTMSDIGAELTNSLDRNGRGTMLAPLRIADGTVGAPALAFNSEASTGWYKPAAHIMAIAVSAVQVATFSDTGISLLKPVTVTGALTLTGALAITGGLSLTAPLTLPDGTELLPALAFTGDTDTGLWHPAANTLAWSTNAVERMRLNTVGLGVGVSAANSFAFEAQGATVNSAIARFSGDTVQTRGLELASYAVGAVNGVGFRFNNPGSGANDGNTSFSFGSVSPDVMTMHAAGVAIRSPLITGPTLFVDRLGTSVLPTGGFTVGTAAAFVANLAAGSPVYLALNSGNTSQAGINFGDTDADSRGWVRYNHTSDHLQFATAGTAGAFLDSSNRWLVNTNAVAYTPSGHTTPTNLQSASISAGAAGLGMAAFYGATTTGVRIAAMKSRGAVLGTMTVAVSNDLMLTLSGAASDGTDFIRATAIDFAVDGAPAAGFVPGRILFSTAPVGGAVTERMRIAGTGQVTIQTPEAATSSLVVEQSAGGGSAIITNTAPSGGTATWRLENSNNTASSAAMLQIVTGGATAADPIVQFTVSGATSWSLGIDNSDSDKFIISTGAALGTTDRYEITTTGNHTMVAPDSGNTLTVAQLAGASGFGIVQNNANSGFLNQWTLQNSSNTANSGAVLLIQTEVSGLDPVLRFNIDTGSSWCVGIDNSDGDAFVISESTVVGTSNRLRIDTATNLVSVGVAPADGDDSLNVATTSYVNNQVPAGLGTAYTAPVRAFATTYTNTLDRPLCVSVSFDFNDAVNVWQVSFLVAGSTRASCSGVDVTATKQQLFMVVPPGVTYRVDIAGAGTAPTIAQWSEC